MILPEFNNFNINRIITHEVFQRNEAREIVPPSMSNEITILDNDGKIELATRIVDAVGQNSKSVEMDIAKTEVGSVYDYVNQIMNNPDDEIFINMSQNITMNLANAQTSRNFPGGILVAIDGTTGINENKYVAVIKAELQGGFQKTSHNTIAYVRDLLLTPQQKLYKIGIYLQKDDGSIRAFVYDFNMSKSEENGIAIYFYDQFLGCTVSHTDKYFTNKFYFETKKFIDDHGEFNDEEIFDLHTHLYSYLKSESSIINIMDFSEQYISDPTKKVIYDEYMQTTIGDEGFNRAITKDITDIKTKLRMRKVTFTNKVKISAPSAEFENNVKIIEEFERDGKFITSIEIAGKVSELDS